MDLDALAVRVFNAVDSEKWEILWAKEKERLKAVLSEILTEERAKVMGLELQLSEALERIVEAKKQSLYPCLGSPPCECYWCVPSSRKVEKPRIEAARYNINAACISDNGHAGGCRVKKQEPEIGMPHDFLMPDQYGNPKKSN